jgi:hypothetical protein
MDIIDDRTKCKNSKYYQLKPGMCFYFKDRPSDIFLCTAIPIESFSDIKLLNKIFAPSEYGVDYTPNTCTAIVYNDIKRQLESLYTDQTLRVNVCVSLRTGELGFPATFFVNVVVVNAVLHIKD